MHKSRCFLFLVEVTRIFRSINNVTLWQCDVFVYVSCAQTALLDSKEFLAPVITPFEAMLAFSRYCFRSQLLVDFINFISFGSFF